MQTKQRGPLTPKVRDGFPKALLLSYSDHDVRRGRVPDDKHAIAIYQRLRAKMFTALSHDTPAIGAEGNCHQTVEMAVKLMGGGMSFGWLYAPQPVRTGKNAFAGYALVAHTVWELDGVLYETIPAYKGITFILDERLVFGCQAGIGFLDRAEDAKRCGFDAKNLMARTIELSKCRIRG